MIRNLIQLLTVVLLLATADTAGAGVVIDMPAAPDATASADATYVQHVNGKDAVDPGALALARYAGARRVPTSTTRSWPRWSGYRYTYGSGVYYLGGVHPFFFGHFGHHHHHHHRAHASAPRAVTAKPRFRPSNFGFTPAFR